MSNLFASLRGAAGALEVFQRQLTVAQNNVANASTPGFARQRLSLSALPFDPDGGLPGGVKAGPVETARDVYSEEAVQRETTSLGKWEQQVASLSPLQQGFDLTGGAGIPGALNELFQSFSAWSVTPNDPAARITVMNSAQTVSQAFRETAGRLSRASADADNQMRGMVDEVNALADQLRDFNSQRKAGNQDTSIDAGMYATLEQLSELAPVTALRQPDGSLTVLLAGQTPLVVGDHQYRIGSGLAAASIPPPAFPSGPPSSAVLDSSGRDITGQISSGKIGGLLQVRNGIIASLRGDSGQQGKLNQLAQAVADRVNAVLTAGNISDGPPPVPGVPLFSYDATNPTAIAATLVIDPGASADQLAAIDPGPPYASNGVALKLAALASPVDAADKIGSSSYTQFYGEIAATVGRAVATAQDGQRQQQDLASQARSLREQTSGVSLDEEAITVLQFQRSYEAAAKLISVLDDLAQTAVNILR